MNGGIDKRQARAAFNRAADSYDAHALLQREVGGRLLERLDCLPLSPARVLDLGCGTGEFTRALGRRYRGAELLALDLAERMLARTRQRFRWWRRPRLICGDMERLPLADHSVDLVFSNLALQWSNEPARVFEELRRVLRPDGALFFTTLGPDTLRELRAAWAEVDGGTHVNRFMDLHDIGDALLAAGLRDPVTDMERLTLTYADLRGLLDDLRGLGAHNVNRDRPRAMTGKRRWQAFEAAYEVHRGADGRLPATWEVVYGHALGRDLATTAGGEVRVPVDILRAPRR